MQKPGVISDYLDSLKDALSFDRSLSRCVRQEVEDHLREAVAADPTRDRLEAERRAVANFGDPHVIAAQFAIVSLARETRRASVAVILVIAAVFATMKARVAWYGVTQWTTSDHTRAVGAMVGSIDRYAFWLSFIVAIAALAYIGSHRIPVTLHGGYRKQLRRSFLLCAAATTTLVVSVISDGMLTALRLLATELSAASLVPIFSMAIEIGCAGVLIFQLRAITRRAASTALLVKT
jgi:hypothetical protein